ncbi:MAG TPA: hypothetical protein VK636_01265 [Gemmatimonadaceae bacterium]|nr:hypothetical protein [Gemmatimonadaceae bacterium]
MTSEPTRNDAPASEASLQQLRDVRKSLLRLHKTLLDAERVRYERVNGRIEGGGILLQLVIHDPWFGWLRPLSALVVQIDERLDADEPTRVSEAKALIDQVKALLRPSEGGEDVFQENYHAALQQTPDVVIAHRDVTVLLHA